MGWLPVVAVVVLALLLARGAVAGHRPPPRPPGVPVFPPSNEWPQTVWVRHDVHVWHHVVDDRPPLQGGVVRGRVEPWAPPELPPGGRR